MIDAGEKVVPVKRPKHLPWLTQQEHWRSPIKTRSKTNGYIDEHARPPLKGVYKARAQADLETVMTLMPMKLKKGSVSTVSNLCILCYQATQQSQQSAANLHHAY